MSKLTNTLRNSRLRSPKPCFIYVVGVDRGDKGYAVKVGISDNVEARMASLQGGAVEPLTLHFAFKMPARWMALLVEGIFHRSFDHRRLRGEWFRMPPNGALLLLSCFIARVLGSAVPRPELAAARREARLLDCFDITDRTSRSFQLKWDAEFERHARWVR